MQEEYEEEGLIYGQADGEETTKVHRRSIKAAAALRQEGPCLHHPLDVLGIGTLLMRRVHPLSDAGGDGGQRDHCASRAIKLALRRTVTTT